MARSSLRRHDFQSHVAGALNGPLVILLQQNGADQPGERRLIGENADHVAASLISPFSRSMKLVERILARCWAGNPIGQHVNSAPSINAAHFGTLG